MTHLLFGLVAICAGLGGVFLWWDDFGEVLRGFIPIVLIVVGIVAIGAGLANRVKTEEWEAAP